MGDPLKIGAEIILDSLGDGVYVTDTERKILYWNQSAERITGWRSEDIVGSRCFDNILAHVDKDGHPLCGEEHCPLHRSMVTGLGSGCPLLFAQHKDGRRIPVRVTVAPVRDASGEVIGGVEVFHDISAALQDMEKARAIQSLSMRHDLPEDARIRFSACYVPHDIVGGDFQGIKQLDADRYGVLLADVMGHGVAAALYTMHLSSLWDRYHPLLASPSDFAKTMNEELHRVVKGGESFATAMCGLIDLESRAFRFSGAGGPPALLMHSGGTHECLECSGLPLGIVEDAPYDEASIALDEGDRLLLFSDGAVEIENASGEMLGIEGLIGILKQGYPESGGSPESDIRMSALEEELLRYSNAIRLEDDLTILEIRFQG